MSARISWIWLAERQNIGAVTVAGLLEALGSADAVFAADRRTLTTCACVLSKRQVDALCDKDTSRAVLIIENCAKLGVSILTLDDAGYPDRLRAIADPPPVLYVRGSLPDLDVLPGISVVGTRSCTAYGEETAQAIGSALAETGFVTVSGMAKGIDGMAQRGALRAGGLTVAVLAGGVDICYPQSNLALMGDILLRGALVSEHPPGTEHRAEFFPPRNRIISGLTVATVVVEASSMRSGAIITAHHALEQGRDVYAVPGALNAKQSAGCLQLIEQGEAALLASPASLVRAYGGLLPRQPDQARVRQAFLRQTGMKPQPAVKNVWDDIQKREERGRVRREAPKAETPKPLPDYLSAEERQIAALVQQGASSPAEIIERCDLAAARVMAIITMLEMDGVLHHERGKLALF